MTMHLIGVQKYVGLNVSDLSENVPLDPVLGEVSPSESDESSK